MMQWRLRLSASQTSMRMCEMAAVWSNRFGPHDHFQACFFGFNTSRPQVLLASIVFRHTVLTWIANSGSWMQHVKKGCRCGMC